MGVTDPVVQAHEEIKINLRYELDLTKSDQFRTAIRFCGLERFRLCLRLVMLWQRPETPSGEKHKRLLALMRLTAPVRNPNAKLRNPQAAAAVAMNDELDQQAMAAMARDKS